MWLFNPNFCSFPAVSKHFFEVNGTDHMSDSSCSIFYLQFTFSFEAVSNNITYSTIPREIYYLLPCPYDLPYLVSGFDSTFHEKAIM